MADHTAIVTEVRELMEAGQTAAAKRLLRQYTTRGADSGISEDLADRAKAVLDRATEAHTGQLDETRRTRSARETAQPRSAIRTRRGTPRRGRSHSEARADRKADQYFAQREDSPAGDERAEVTVYGSGLDYDLAAVAPMRGRGCLFCGIERSNVDRARGDGLCADCRDSGLTRADYIATRCAALAERVTREGRVSVRDALVAGWKRANTGDRALIEAWVRDNPQPTEMTER